MRFLSIVITISKFRDIQSGTEVLHQSDGPWDDRKSEPVIYRSPGGRDGVSIFPPRAASTDGGSPISSPPPLPRQRRGELFSPSGVGLPVIPREASIGSGSAVHEPFPRFDHATRKEVNEFLKLHGDSVDGEFGLDKTHKPDLSWEFGELIPGGVLSADPAQDYAIALRQAPIYKQAHTGVYDIVRHPEKVIKYHAYCFDSKTDPYDAIVVEAYFMNRLADKAPGLTLKVDFYSGYVSTPPALSPGRVGKIPDMTCPGGVQPHIRYMIMDRVGPSLIAHMQAGRDRRIPFLEAMTLGKQMIQLMQRLHKLQIIHGDAHMGNFAFESDVEGSKLILIDFGRSQFVEEGAPEPDRVKDCQMIHPYAALWEIDGCRVSFRDDVYRAVQMTAMSIYGMIHYDYLGMLTRIPDLATRGDPHVERDYSARVKKFRRIKNSANFWDFGGLFDLNEKIGSSAASVDSIPRIRPHLMTISRLIVNPRNHFSKPNYDGIIDEYDAIIAILSPPAAAEAAAPAELHHPGSFHIHAAGGFDV
jgi:hypothetical protein